MATIAPPRLLTVPDTAARLGVSNRTAWRLIATGAIKSVRVGARGTRISEAALADFIAKLPEAR